jgi:hypothetical protein
MTKLDSKYNDYRYLKAIERYKIQNAIKSKAKRFYNDNINVLQILDELSNEQKKINFQDTIEYRINNFYYNVSNEMYSNLFQYGKLSEKQLAFISTFKDKMRNNLDKYNKNNAEKMQSKPIGTVGNRQEFKLTILKVKESELQVSYSNYVTSYKHDLIDDNKNLFTLYSSKNYLEENNNNNEINISAIVKGHKTFNNINYTLIKCPKIIK